MSNSAVVGALRRVTITLSLILGLGASVSADEIKSYWLDDCSKRIAPLTSRKFNPKECSCMYDVASEKLNKIQLLASEIAGSYRKINSIEKPKVTEIDLQKIQYVSIGVTMFCLNDLSD